MKGWWENRYKNLKALNSKCLPTGRQAFRLRCNGDVPAPGVKLRFACLGEAASAKAGHARVNILTEERNGMTIQASLPLNEALIF